MSHEPITVGILLPTRDAGMSGRFEVAPLLAMAERVEAAGYDSIWVLAHLVAPVDRVAEGRLVLGGEAGE